MTEAARGQHDGSAIDRAMPSSGDPDLACKSTSAVVQQDDVTPDLAVGFIVTPDFTLLAFAGFVDALRIAGDVGERSRQVRCRWSLVGADLRPVPASCGVTISPDETFGEPAKFDYLVIVGGPLTDDLVYDDAMLTYLRRAGAQGIPLVGVGTGAIVLAQAGLMDGYRCCVYGDHDIDVSREFPNIRVVRDDVVVVDRDRLTCAGGTAVIDLAAILVDRHCGHDRALKILPHLVVDGIRSPNHQPLPLVDGSFRSFDDRVKRALVIMERHMNNPPRINQIAGRVGSSVRQLERSFRSSVGVSPQTYYRAMRLRHGRWLLTHTKRTVTQIADDCGFADASHFSRCFKRAFRQVPSELRRRRTG